MLTPTTSGYAPVNGVEIYYETYGSGDPLVLLHGGLGAIEMFEAILPALAAGRQLIGVDFQAHGRTLPFDRPLTFEALATDVAELIRYLGHAKAEIMGYSLGGSVALRLAIDHPEMVGRLVVASAPYAFSGWHDYNQQGMSQISGAQAEAMKPSPIYELYARIAPDAGNWPRLLDQVGGLLKRPYDWSADIARITAPTMLVVGDYDSVRISHATAFFELLGGGKTDALWDGSGMTPNRFAVIPGATHYNIVTDPRLAEAAVGFLSAPASATMPAAA